MQTSQRTRQHRENVGACTDFGRQDHCEPFPRGSSKTRHFLSKPLPEWTYMRRRDWKSPQICMERLLKERLRNIASFMCTDSFSMQTSTNAAFYNDEELVYEK